MRRPTIGTEGTRSADINNMYYRDPLFELIYSEMEREEKWEEKIGKMYWLPVADTINYDTSRDSFDDVMLKYLIHNSCKMF